MARNGRNRQRRLRAARGGLPRRGDRPEFAGNPRLELAERTRAMPYGGIGTMLRLARDVGLTAKLDDELDVVQRPHPYTDADHEALAARDQLRVAAEILTQFADAGRAWTTT
ncbi:MAG TPA: hypothetical protein ENK57_25875 [Polyangiaceae bacterium]|nr:hypothetical protein [Polyangiaceae bacterium]